MLFRAVFFLLYFQSRLPPVSGPLHLASKYLLSLFSARTLVTLVLSKGYRFLWSTSAVGRAPSFSVSLWNGLSVHYRFRTQIEDKFAKENKQLEDNMLQCCLLLSGGYRAVKGVRVVKTFLSVMNCSEEVHPHATAPLHQARIKSRKG